MGLFHPENLFFRTMSRMVDVVGLSLMWVFLCLPVVTAGPATAALYHTVVRAFREGDDLVFLRYVRSVRQNLKVGIPAGLICIGLGVCLFFSFEIMYAHRGGGLEALTYAIYYVAMLVPLGTACYIFPLLGRFTFRLSELFRTALQMALAHLPTTVIVVLLTMECVTVMLRYLWLFLFMPVLLTVLQSLFLERVFQQHMPKKHPKESAYEGRMDAIK